MLGREIEFRAWNKTLKKFDYTNCSAFVIYENRLCINNYGDLCQLSDYENPEQFTGLLDKNGKKIFEGDILQNEKGDRITCIFEVKDGISLFNLFDKKNPKRMYFCINKYFEIIGNIHDNPELVGETK